MTYSFPNLELVHYSVSSSNCCFLTCIQVSQETGKVVWYSHPLKNFPQFAVTDGQRSRSRCFSGIPLLFSFLAPTAKQPALHLPLIRRRNSPLFLATLLRPGLATSLGRGGSTLTIVSVGQWMPEVEPLTLVTFSPESQRGASDSLPIVPSLSAAHFLICKVGPQGQEGLGAWLILIFTAK